MAQELQLQEVLAVVRANGSGLATIIQMLVDLQNNHADNPAIQDEIDAIKSEAQNQATRINEILNPAVEPPA